MSKEIATTIYNQLGGRRFMMITGSKNPAADSNSLKIKLARNHSGANYLQISLNGKDLYDVRFFKFSMKQGIKEVKKYHDLFADQLREIFERETGLYTTL